MKAVVVDYDASNYELDHGDEIEVIGFVGSVGSDLHAVWRDDEGYVWTIAVSKIRMLPNTGDTVVMSKAAYDKAVKVSV